MAQYGTTPRDQEHVDVIREDVASPAPLGLSILAFATALIGCFYAGFIIPYAVPAIRVALGPVLLISGIVLILAGMWEFRKNYTISATIFTTYGGFLAAVGLVFMPTLGIISALGGVRLLSLTLGLIFLCWTIVNAILFLGTLRTNVSLMVSMLLLTVAFLLLTIGQLAFDNRVLLAIGGWIAIVCALFTWLAAAASILSTTGVHGGFRLPLGQKIAAVE
ncbi:hypothetical protein EPA93_07910 [Ktedonosporobacter rubrisoli]|uniref:Uncharacterized protein n=1 Tax=Ktedonosporobacter rubrisoli TaxID=2509675 RepID=A0A4P6JL45_KTERU|nr:GPR1/FUN34/YaaH family transporter [Ktedonosporobacter rubrisoli]QBD75937.1 hypothetical protein EPA93_07910 [Ktedonosporobacter rubrisoli]